MPIIPGYVVNIFNCKESTGKGMYLFQPSFKILNHKVPGK